VAVRGASVKINAQLVINNAMATNALLISEPLAFSPASGKLCVFDFDKLCDATWAHLCGGEQLMTYQ